MGRPLGFFLFLGKNPVFLPTCFSSSRGRISPKNAVSPTVAGDGLVLPWWLDPGFPQCPASEGEWWGPAPGSSRRRKGQPGNGCFCIQLINWRQLKNGAGGGSEGFAPVVHGVSAGWASKAELLKSSHESSLPM